MGIHRGVKQTTTDYIGVDGRIEKAHLLEEKSSEKKFKKRGTKKTKKGWRKFINLDDVENYLEEKRKESIQLGDTVENIKDEKLFFVDTYPNSKETDKEVSSGTCLRTHKEILKGNNDNHKRTWLLKVGYFILKEEESEL